MAISCSHWWHAPVYLTVSITLITIAIKTPSSSSSSSSKNPQTPLDFPVSRVLSTNASRALRDSGFNFMATLLQVSPELFLPPSESTIFAIHDDSVSNISLPPSLMKALLLYHTSPSKVSITDLLKHPQGSCVPTLLHGKNLELTKIKVDERLVEINGVLISHPDIFTQGLYSIHGVHAPFASFNQLAQQENSNFIPSPICDSNLGIAPNVGDSRNRVPWSQIPRLLSSKGYVSFAIGLHLVLDGIIKDYGDLTSVTLLAAPEFPNVASRSPFLDRIVKFHILPERFGYNELVSLPEKTSLKTLASDCKLEVTAGYYGREILNINGVEIIAADILSSKEFVVHGISRPFEILKCWPNSIGFSSANGFM